MIRARRRRKFNNQHTSVCPVSARYQTVEEMAQFGSLLSPSHNAIIHIDDPLKHPEREGYDHPISSRYRTSFALAMNPIGLTDATAMLMSSSKFNPYSRPHRDRGCIIRQVVCEKRPVGPGSHGYFLGFPASAGMGQVARHPTGG